MDDIGLENPSFSQGFSPKQATRSETRSDLLQKGGENAPLLQGPSSPLALAANASPALVADTSGELIDLGLADAPDAVLTRQERQAIVSEIGSELAYLPDDVLQRIAATVRHERRVRLAILAMGRNRGR